MNKLVDTSATSYDAKADGPHAEFSMELFSYNLQEFTGIPRLVHN